MHHQLFQYILLLLLIIFLVMLAQRLRVAAPILLVLAGLPLGFVPAFRGVEIDPDLIFIVFLPPLLYEAAWTTSWKNLWRWRRLIASFAVIIVIITAGAIAFVSHWMIPGFTLALGFLLGAIVSPPDAVAAGNVLRNVKVPRRFLSIIEGESLLNDASSLVIFRFALIAVTTGHFAFGGAALSFVLVILGGIAIGLAVALVFYAIHRWLPTSANMDILLTFITPYALYVAGEAAHVSGVLAVVSGGLFLSARREKILSSRSRLQGFNVWEAVAFALNNFIFILIGLEFPVVISALDGEGVWAAVKYSAIIVAVLVVGRFACTFGSLWWTIFISRYITVADARPGWRGPVMLGWTGMRGVVSLAAALSIPELLPSGMPFPERALILFITFTVIIFTIVVQGATLPWLARLVNMPDPDITMPFEQQTQLVRKKLAALQIRLLEERYAQPLRANDMVRALHLRLSADMELLKDWEQEHTRERTDDFYREYRRITDDLMLEQRELLRQLNRKDNINDEIITQQLELLDIEEEKMRQYFSLEKNIG